MPLEISTPIPCKAGVEPINVVPNSAIYSIGLSSSIVNGQLMVSGFVTFTRTQFDGQTQTWVVDPRTDASKSEAFGDIAVWLQENPSLAQAALSLWESIDQFAAQLNSTKQLV